MNETPSALEEELFLAALDLKSGEERILFLEKACGEDKKLRETVERMLSSFYGGERLFNAISPTSVSVMDLAESLRKQPGNGTTSGEDDPELGKCIGPYRILRKIGEGGGGNVYLAEQDLPVHRQVALKIIRHGMDSRHAVARFEAELQVLAMMEHPNIARVFDAGTTTDGRPYFVMELVHGTPLTTYCEEQGLDIGQRLDLFIHICHAIQHAHQKGIIHRDIKPSNILTERVEGMVVPKVIDFGIAKTTGEQQLQSGHTALTVMQPFVGTPAYMSPEQADLTEQGVDVRSDIYSMGVLLYELLTGQTPFDQKKLIRSGLEEMLRTIRERDPPRPSVRLSALPEEELANIAKGRSLHPRRLLALLEGDLDWIVMKALEKDPERRYRSADGFAEDIQRHLNHEPVVARPPSRIYRFRKMVRRNKAVFASGVTVVAVLLISSSVSTWLLIEQQVARKRAQRAEEEKGTIQKEAEALRTSVENQQKLAQAMVLYRRGEIEQADAMIDGISRLQASPGNASMYRDLGDWHALNGRWDMALERYQVLNDINTFEGLDSTMDDSRLATLLVEQGNLESYERFRESLISRYAGTDSPVISQRVIRECLLAPANDELMNTLNPYASVTDRSYYNTDKDQAVKGWQAYSMALFTYRKGQFYECLYWCGRANPENSGFPTRDLSIQFIKSAALMKLDHEDEARDLLTLTRAECDRILSMDPAKTSLYLGFWFDRVTVKIHLREAESVINGTSVPTE